MALSAKTCYEHIRSTLGRDPGLGNFHILQMTGVWFTSAHDWKYLERPSALVGFVNGQSYASLPADFSELIAASFTQGLTNRFLLTTLGTIAQYRTGQMNFGLAVTYGAISFQAATGAGGAPLPVLELYPTPSATNASALTVFYRADWTPITDGSDSSFVNIPQYAEPAFIECLRAFARGYQEEDSGILSQRLAAIQAGPVWDAAVDSDGMTQPNFGKMRGGATQIGIGGPQTVWASPYSIASP